MERMRQLRERRRARATMRQHVQDWRHVVQRTALQPIESAEDATEAVSDLLAKVESLEFRVGTLQTALLVADTAGNHTCLCTTLASQPSKYDTH